MFFVDARQVATLKDCYRAFRRSEMQKENISASIDDFISTFTAACVSLKKKPLKLTENRFIKELPNGDVSISVEKLCKLKRCLALSAALEWTSMVTSLNVSGNAFGIQGYNSLHYN
jgi:hypothetical protein